MFEVPGTDTIGVHVTEDAVNGKVPLTYLRRPKKESSASQTNAKGADKKGEETSENETAERRVGSGWNTR